MATTTQPASYVGTGQAQPGRLLGLKKMAVSALVNLLSAGLPWSAVEMFLKQTGFTQQELAQAIATPERTLARRKEAGKLNLVESERLLRLAEIFQGATDLFEGNTTAARKWLQSPERGLGNVSPMDYAVTDIGAREVRNLIGRLEYGVFS